MPPKKDREYRELNLHQHVLHRPDTYVGSVKIQREEEYVVTGKEWKITRETIRFVPALLRIFVEALSNAVDNVWESKEYGIPCKKIKISIDKETGETTVWNDGLSIPIKINEQTGVYNPEMIFGRLLTSSNFNDEERRYKSGRNGVGAKAVSIFSKRFKIRVLDPESSKLYVQTWRNNMYERDPPKITTSKLKTGFTEVTWVPDFERFKLEKYTRNILRLYQRYVADAAMVTKVSVYFNDEKVPIKSLEDYAKCYESPTDEFLSIKTKDSEVVLTSSKEFQHISFVNGVHTSDGGVHIDAWSEAIFRPLVNKFNKKGKPQVNINHIKQFFRLFVNCTVPNPEFTSQSKTKFASPSIEPKIPKSVFTKLGKWEFVEQVNEIIKGKELVKLKKTEGKRGKKNVPGLDPANKAGGRYSKDCTLILCEGLSAKTYAVKGIEVGVFGKSGRDWMGILPLRGKCLNVRNATVTSISNNKEIMGITQALGLHHGVDYTVEKNFNTLNYGRVLTICDADEDGLHINGLILNFFHSMFPSLFNRKERFITRMLTPVARILASRNSLEKLFYNEIAFRRFLESKPDRKFRIKYYKGLGTSSDKEVLKTFGKRVEEFVLDENANQNMNKVFNKSYSDARKRWLEEFNPDDIKEECPTESKNTIAPIEITKFIDNDMIRFSIADCKRSLPELMDGMKESHRKILYACFLRNLNYKGKSLKVAQLGGYVAEKTNYHHGEQNLFETITKMAENFPGSNNIHLLYRDGQFGTRSYSGKDAASPRYIFTKLEALTRLIFRPEDDVLLQRMIDDGDVVEPKFYVPIIPMILVNGCMGIGTGWSCSIPCYDPLDLIDCIKIWLDQNGKVFSTTDEDDFDVCLLPELTPSYRGFTGEIQKESESKYITIGKCYKEGRKWIVDEIPIGTSIDKFKVFLEDLEDKKLIRKLNNYSSPQKPRFEIFESENGIRCDENSLRLYSYIHTSNMVLFVQGDKLRKFEDIEHIIDHFCQVRYEYYTKRKTYYLQQYTIELKMLKNKQRFLSEVLEGKLDLKGKKKDNLYRELAERKYYKKQTTEEDEGSYDYLLRMQFLSATKEKIEQLEQDILKVENTFKKLKTTSEKELWINDLNEFVKAYKQWCMEQEKN